MKTVLWTVGWVSGLIGAMSYVAINDPWQRIAFVIIFASASTMVFNQLLQDYVRAEVKRITLEYVARALQDEIDAGL
jgi:hypothetical protein